MYENIVSGWPVIAAALQALQEAAAADYTAGPQPPAPHHCRVIAARERPSQVCRLRLGLDHHLPGGGLLLRDAVNVAGIEHNLPRAHANHLQKVITSERISHVLLPNTYRYHHGACH